MKGCGPRTLGRLYFLRMAMPVYILSQKLFLKRWWWHAFTVYFHLNRGGLCNCSANDAAWCPRLGHKMQRSAHLSLQIRCLPLERGHRVGDLRPHEKATRGCSRQQTQRGPQLTQHPLLDMGVNSPSYNSRSWSLRPLPEAPASWSRDKPFPLCHVLDSWYTETVRDHNDCCFEPCMCLKMLILIINSIQECTSDCNIKAEVWMSLMTGAILGPEGYPFQQVWETPACCVTSELALTDDDSDNLSVGVGPPLKHLPEILKNAQGYSFICPEQSVYKGDWRTHSLHEKCLCL